MSGKNCPIVNARRGFLPCSCGSHCASRLLGCCNSENTSLNCVGPVNLTNQWDTGSRPCCPGAGEKYSALGGLLNYCSLNGGSEHPDGRRVLVSFPRYKDPNKEDCEENCEENCKEKCKENFRNPTKPVGVYGIY